MNKISIIIIFVMVLCSFSVFGDYTDNLTAYYNFNENNGTKVIDNVNNLNGSMIGNVAWQSIAKSGSGINFTNVGNEYITITNSVKFNFQYNMTVSYWIKFNTLTLPGTFMSKGYSGSCSNGNCHPYVLSFLDQTNEHFGSYKAGDYNWVTMKYNNFSTTQFEHVVFRINGTHMSLFKNNILVNNVSFLGKVLPTNSLNLTIGAYNNAGSYSERLNAVIDEIALWNRSLSDSEIDNLYNNGDGFFYPFISGSNPLIVNNVVLRNASNSLYGSSFVVGELFKVAGNVTYNGVFNSSLACEYNSSNTWEIYNYYNNNISFYNTNYSTVFVTNSASNVLNDSFSFRICKEGVLSNSDALVFVNNTFQKRINSAQIPLCSIGFHEESFFSNTSFDLSKSLQVSCSGVCNSANQLRIISQTGNVSSLLKRNYLTHRETLTANTSSQLYEDADNGLHFFSSTGTKSIGVNCSGGGFVNNITSNYTLTPLNIQSSILEIISDNTTYVFVNNTQIESGINYSIIGDCFGGITTLSSQMNVSFTNTTLINSVSTEFIILNKSDLNQDGIYNVSLFCQGLNTSSISKGFFRINDSIPPYITWISPDTSGTTETNRYTSQFINVIFTDINLYVANISCVNSLGINVFNSGNQFINGTSAYEISGNSNNNTVLGAVTCTACVSDAHTKKKIPDLYYYQINSTLIFEDSDGKKLSIEYEDNKEPFIVEKSLDRYSFTPKTKYKHMNELNFRINCDNVMNYIVNSGFSAHFICDDKWIDFEIEGLSIKNYQVIHVIGNEYRVKISIPPGLDNYKTKSIGIINTNCDTAYYNVVEPSTSTGIVFSWSDLIVPGIFIIIWIMILVIALSGISIFFVLAGLLGIIGSLYVWEYSVLLTSVLILVNLMIMWLFVTKN